MAIATFTATTFNLEPRLNVHGPTFTYGTIVTSTRTLSDIGFLLRVPNKATVLDWWMRGSTTETASVFKLGITGAGRNGSGAGSETTFGTRTFSVNADPTMLHGMTLGAGVNHCVSLSDTDAQRGATVYMTISAGTWTTSVSIDFMFAWLIDGLGRTS